MVLDTIKKEMSLASETLEIKKSFSVNFEFFLTYLCRLALVVGQ